MDKHTTIEELLEVVYVARAEATWQGPSGIVWQLRARMTSDSKW
jgi:hypothetical protein